MIIITKQIPGKILTFFIGAALLIVGIPAILSAPTGEVDLATATGTFTFSGNVTSGELVNITHPNGSVYRFEFNATNGSTCRTTDCIPVNLTGSDGRYWNQSYYASGNLTATINANATVASFVTAANTTNTTTITASIAGVAGNSITLSDNTLNVVSSGLAGGVDEIALSLIGTAIVHILLPLVFLFGGLYLMWSSLPYKK